MIEDFGPNPPWIQDLLLRNAIGPITTTKGQLDVSLMRRIDGYDTNDDREVWWTEFWLDGDESCDHTFDPDSERLPDLSFVCLGCGAHQVQRSAHVRMKRMPSYADGSAAGFTVGDMA